MADENLPIVTRRVTACYLLRNASAGRLNYGQAKDQQLPNGSGIIESTVRRVLNLRMKGASIFWTKDNAEDTILLRTYYQSGPWKTRRLNTPMTSPRAAAYQTKDGKRE